MDWSNPHLTFGFAPVPALLAQADDAPPPADAPGSPAPAPGTPAAPGTPGTTAPGGADGAPPPSPFGGNFLFIMILVVGMLFIFSMSSGRKEKKRRAQMLEQLAKGAKVQTAGGVLGTVVEVRDEEVVVKVDENSNTRMRFAKSAISAVLED
ncbi:MAG: preprotein translocase subunit YajC [Planctomycetota bacterium]